MWQSAFKSLTRMIIREWWDSDIPHFLNLSTKTSVCKVCKEARIHLLLTTVLSNQKRQYWLHLNLDDVFSGIWHLQTADCRLQTADRRLQTADRRLQTADHRLQTADCRPQTADCRPQTAECKLKDTKNLPNKGDTIKSITSCEVRK